MSTGSVGPPEDPGGRVSRRRTSARRRRELRERRRLRSEAARRSWSDSEFGLHISERRDGVSVIRWSVDRDPFVALMGLDRLRSTVLDGLELALVSACREQVGLSWDEIGWALGVSGEALRKRLGDRVDQLVTDDA